MKEKNNPCFNCPDRHAGCHGTCEAYRNWKAEHDKQRDAERQIDIENYKITEYKRFIRARVKKARE